LPWGWCDLFQCAQLQLVRVWGWSDLFQCVKLQFAQLQLRVWEWSDLFQCIKLQFAQLQLRVLEWSEVFRFAVAIPHKQFFNRSPITGEQFRSPNAPCAAIAIEGGCYPTDPNTNVDEPSAPEFACCSTTYWFAACIDALSNGESYALSPGKPCAPLLTCEPSLGRPTCW